MTWFRYWCTQLYQWWFARRHPWALTESDVEKILKGIVQTDHQRSMDPDYLAKKHSKWDKNGQ